jgi:hypothetical protein
MSLDTVLRIGQTLRTPKGLRYHRYFKTVESDIANFAKNKDDNKNPISTLVYNLPVINVGEELDFDFENMEVITDEDKIKSLLSLNFKTADKDNKKKYICGDIVRCEYKNDKGEVEETGNYYIRRKAKKPDNSFERGKPEVSDLMKGRCQISLFRRCFEKNIRVIEDKVLSSAPAVVIHFAFQDGLDWYQQFGVEQAVKNLLLDSVIYEDKVDGRDVFVLSKSLIKTLKSPIWEKKLQDFKDPLGSGSTPGFGHNSGYKLYAFNSKEDVDSIMYVMDFLEKSKVTIGTDVGILLLPNGENLSFEALTKFLGKPSKDDDKIVDAETEVLAGNDSDFDDIDELFAPVILNDFDDLVRFDVIFLKPKKGAGDVSIDKVEISSLQKSHFRIIHEQTSAVRRQVYEEFRVQNGSKKFRFQISSCVSNILKPTSKSKNDKRGQYHLLKILPQIYLDCYYEDTTLLPAFLSKVEWSIQNEDVFYYNIFRYNFIFLLHLQKNKPYSQMIESSSYQIGRQLGIMAQPFAAWRKNCPIKSFEKSYVGNLTRRIAYREDLVKFSNFLNEKLAIHERLNNDQQSASRSLAKDLAMLQSNNYNKHEAALGFFESYFEKTDSKSKASSDEITDSKQ